MADWTVRVHPQAEAELKAIPADMQARFLHIAELLEAFGPQKVGMPLERKLWEMRMHGRDASPGRCMPPSRDERSSCCTSS